MPPNQKLDGTLLSLVALQHEQHNDEIPHRFRCAIIGCGMMGQEHISYISGYPKDIRVDYLVDPFQPSLDEALRVFQQFQVNGRCSDGQEEEKHQPILLHSEEELLQNIQQIDLLVISSPNYLHTASLLKWGKYDLAILVEKPVAVSQTQLECLEELAKDAEFKARIWVGMEYRYIPAVAKLTTLIPTIGDIKMITIRENRYPFLDKIGTWNRDPKKTGDTLVEKCCHFFDLFRLITGQEIVLPSVRALAQRGLNYHDEEALPGVDTPIIDAAYVILPFTDGKNAGGPGETQEASDNEPKPPTTTTGTIGCLELCMYAEGSRHQEEIIVTGTKGRLEAYLPENTVYSFERPSLELWKDRSVPPPKSAIKKHVYDCSDVKDVHGIENNEEMPTHGGYHYCSTAVEWYRLLAAMKQHAKTGLFVPEVSLNDGMSAVRIGLQASAAILNEQGQAN